MNAFSKDSSSESWVLTASDHALVMAKHRTNRVGFAVLVLFFRENRRFPRALAEIGQTRIRDIAEQIAIDSPSDLVLNMTGRTVERQRAEIRALFGYRQATVADAECSKLGS